MKKLNNRKGFTLMEMLIVVAIIAILVIIAIPTFNSALAKSRAATDLANIRSGYAAAQVEAMTEGIKSATGNADNVDYYLQKDGSVATGNGADGNDAYVCAGVASKADATATIGGGQTAVEVNWKKGAKIKYNVKDNKDGTFSVTISATETETTTGSGN